MPQEGFPFQKYQHRPNIVFTQHVSYDILNSKWHQIVIIINSIKLKFPVILGQITAG